MNTLAAALEAAGVTSFLPVRDIVNAVYDRVEAEAEATSTASAKQRKPNRRNEAAQVYRKERRVEPMTTTKKQIAISNPDAPHSFKQRVAIVSLSKKVGTPVQFADVLASGMTRQQASALIDKLLAKLNAAQPEAQSTGVQDLIASLG